MRIPATYTAQKELRAGHRANGIQQSELQISKRPQFLALTVVAYALAVYNLETAHTVSRTMNIALRRFLRAKYIGPAEQMLKNSTRKTQLAPSSVKVLIDVKRVGIQKEHADGR